MAMAGAVLLVEDHASVGGLVPSSPTPGGYRWGWGRAGEDALAELDPPPVRRVLVDILAYFMANVVHVVSRDLLLGRVWGQEYPGGTRTVDVHVAQLRRKLGRPDLIRTLRGTGYKAASQ